jgi:hypothetical protein
MSGTASGKAKKVPTRNYAFGYAKTPVDSRFKEGKSGNPRGRPKNRKNPIKEFQEEMTKSVVLREGSKTRRVSFFVALLRQIQQDAIKGNRWARAELLKFAKELDWPDAEVEVAAASDVRAKLSALIERTAAAHNAQKREQDAARKAARERKAHEDSVRKAHNSDQSAHGADRFRTKVHGTLVQRVAKTDKEG